jgi:hypothetical protein
MFVVFACLLLQCYPSHHNKHQVYMALCECTSSTKPRFSSTMWTPFRYKHYILIACLLCFPGLTANCSNHPTKLQSPEQNAVLPGNTSHWLHCNSHFSTCTVQTHTNLLIHFINTNWQPHFFINIIATKRQRQEDTPSNQLNKKLTQPATSKNVPDKQADLVFLSEIRSMSSPSQLFRISAHGTNSSSLRSSTSK